jgi:hypothetical protein
MGVMRRWECAEGKGVAGISRGYPQMTQIMWMGFGGFSWTVEWPKAGGAEPRVIEVFCARFFKKALLSFCFA